MKRIMLLMLISILPQIKMMAEEITEPNNNTGAPVVTTAQQRKKANGRSASDPYLDMAYYKMIDKAGWDKSSVDKYYTYTEYSNDKVAWLTISLYGAFKSVSKQKWTAVSGGTPGFKEVKWLQSDEDLFGDLDIHIFPASSAYFTKTKSYSLYQHGTMPHQLFYVTNVTAVRFYGDNGDSRFDYKTSKNVCPAPLKMRVYECTLNDGTLEKSSLVKEYYSDFSWTKWIEIKDLDASKIYLLDVRETEKTVQGITYHSSGYAVAFKIPLSAVKKPALSVSPTSLTFNTMVSQTQKKTFKITGTDLIDDVSLTLNDNNNVFSLSNTTVSPDNATKGKTVTVTFTPKAAGTYSATVTLSSTGLRAKQLNSLLRQQSHLYVIRIAQQILGIIYCLMQAAHTTFLTTTMRSK